MTPDEAKGLRGRAESYLRNNRSKGKSSHGVRKDPLQLNHELNVYHIELEMQNEELRKVNQALDDSRRRYEELYRTVPLGYFTLDRNGVIGEVNPAGEALAGLSADKLQGQRFHLLVVLRDRELLSAFCKNIVDTGNLQTCELRLLAQSEPSGLRHVLIQGSAVPAKGKGQWIRVVVLDITERKRTERKLQEQESELQSSRQSLKEMNAKLLSAQDDERRMIARELHDDCCQQIALLILSAKTLQPLETGERAHRLQVIIEQLKQLLDTLRQLAYGLHPAVSESLGVKTMMKTYVDNFTRLTQIDVRYEQTGPIPSALPQSVATCLYRTLQETLHNALKYAQASCITVRFRGEPQRMQLTVTDNGKGFDLNSVTGTRGLGLISLRKRVQLLAGTLEISSTPREGTTVTASLPL